MPFEQGVYRIRYCPDGKPVGPGSDTAVAVGCDLDTPIRALPDVPGLEGVKEWKIIPGIVRDQFVINSLASLSVPSGWGRTEGKDGEDVLFSTSVQHWHIKPQGNPDDNVYVISVPSEVDGVTLAVVVDHEDARLVVKSFPVIPDADAFPLPAWHFIFQF